MACFNVFTKLGTRENHLQRWCENPRYLRSKKKKKRGMFSFSFAIWHILGGVVGVVISLLCFLLLRRCFFGPAPGSRWQSAVRFPGLSDGADFQVPTRTICDDGALCFCQPDSSSRVPQLVYNPLQMFSFFLLQMRAGRHQLQGLRTGLLKISLRSWWKSWVCVRWLL